MPVIVTRPQEEALRWVQRFVELGVDAIALPLISIAPPRDPQPLRAAWARMQGFKAAMFVSANAVRHFFAQAPSGAGFRIRAWATGPGTSHALRARGVDAALIDEPREDSAQFDSEALWRVVEGEVRRGDRVLVVRGGDSEGDPAGREWLAERLEDRGCEVHVVVAYRRVISEWDETRIALARSAASDGSQWLFSSSEAIRHLLRLVPGQDWSAARAVATHPRIAEAARGAGFGTVRECRPDFDEVLRSLQSDR
ncbi:MAG TPA: uroporphyrinogen-III synthase [Ramlibacter sp.]|uniref:uroporphyrinogen-III synthase n=1 Tax=Ramlibacter sp. TaxID=1917967 RepID=UPI002C46A903|nr:uroporphyrinogen-III synthase [Ramlibacter sp.]HVZ45309.1 uroporphyrinogen-III synthase [Ramlibacter sp.]